MSRAFLIKALLEIRNACKDIETYDRLTDLIDILEGNR